MFSTALVLTLLASASSAIPTSPQGCNSTIVWKDCFNASVPLKCANFSVPIDWEDPTSEEFDLFITKIPAREEASKIGNLFYQPGGPGDAPSQDFIPGSSHLDFWMNSNLTRVFDFIAIDPRGTGNSNPVRCNNTVWSEPVTLFPNTEEEYDHMKAMWKAAGQSCLDLTGPLLGYIDTISAVKDYEAVRIALGGEPMNMIGQSYGAQFASQYAELFPRNIRAIVLDGVLDHSQTSPTYAWETESQGFELTLNQFFEWCERNSTCALHNETDIPAYFDRLIESANANPIFSQSGCDYGTCDFNTTGYDIEVVVQEFTDYPNGELGTPGFVGLAEAIRSTVEDPSKNPFAEYAIGPFASDTSFIYSYTAIICVDWSFGANTSFAQYRNTIETGKALSPHTLGAGEFWNLAARCQHWPVPTRNPPHQIATYQNSSYKLKTPILLVNAFYDPETNYAWAVNLQSEFGNDNAVLLSRNGSGHTSYFQPGAVSDAIDNYFIHLQVPEPGTVLENDGI